MLKLKRLAGLLICCLTFSALQVRGAPGRPGDGCAQVLLVVAHPDDEVLFAGELLLGYEARLPGGCQRPDFHVIVATNQHVASRREDAYRSAGLFRQKGRLNSIEMEVWNFADCNHQGCESFLQQTEAPPEGETTPRTINAPQGSDMVSRLRALLHSKRWDFVITHNSQGEYFHQQHVGLHRCMVEALTYVPSEIRPPLYVFNPIPEVNQTASYRKVLLSRMAYFASEMAQQNPFRTAIFSAFLTYSEHIVPVELFIRPEIIQLGPYLHGTDVHFIYAQTFWHKIERDPDGTFSSMTRMLKQTVSPYLAKTWADTCGPQSRKHPSLMWYPSTCGALHRATFSDKNDKFLDRGLDRMLAAFHSMRGFQPTSCIKLRPAGRFGSVAKWGFLDISESRAFGATDAALLHIRPIEVGWNQGKKLYKILAKSSPKRPGDVSGSDLPWRIQPHDMFGLETNQGRAGSLCLSKAGCDERGLCVFEERTDEDVSLDIVVKLKMVLPRRAPDGKRTLEVRKSLDLGAYVDHTTTYEEFMTLRQRLKHPDLSLFEDKIRLRKELLPSLGVLATPSIHLSNTDFEVAKYIRDKTAYVVKPSHMSESQNVFVVRDGINLLQRAWGYPDPRVSPEQIEATALTFQNASALKWECNALTGLRPGVVVEELVLGLGPSNQLSVDEYKFYTVWGEVVIGESVPFSSGTAMEISRAGAVLTSRAPCPPYCVSECYGDMVKIAEQVARNAMTDFLRVDILVKGRCEGLFVSEVELYPASNFSPELKDLVASLWRRGYGYGSA